MNRPFPYFFTFDKILDVLENNPNIKNLETVYETVKTVAIIKQKIAANLEEKFQEDATKIIKGLAIYSLWSNGHNGATAKELAERLLILPQNKAFESQMQVSLIVKKIREATDGFYLKVVPDTKTGNDYFKFDPDIDGTDPDERIDTEVNAIGSAEDKLESILFEQIREILDLDYYNNLPNVFTDECVWQTAKSFRNGLVVFSRKGADIPTLAARDYLINLISPYYKGAVKKLCDNQLDIYVTIPGQQNIEHLKRIAAIRSLIAKNILTAVMNKKLQEEIEGTRAAGITRPGIKYKIARWFFSDSEASLNGKQISIKFELGKEYNNLSEIISELKKKVFDDCFVASYPEHPRYSQILTSYNINDSLSRILDELVAGNFTKLRQSTESFLSHLNLLNSNGDIDISSSTIAQSIYTTIADKKGKMVSIDELLVTPFKEKPYGLEPQIVHFYLVILTLLGRISLKAKGGDEIDIANIKEKFRSISQFENIVYALKKEDLSYDFAARLMNAIGLNGNAILKESSRNDAFKLYKIRVKEILDLVKNVQSLMATVKQKSVQFINTDDVETYFQQTQSIDWPSLDIANHAKFKDIEHLNKELKTVSEAIAKLDNLKDALVKYNAVIHDGILYMNEAIEMVENNLQYLTNPAIQNRLNEFCTDTKNIVKDFSRYIRLDERFPLEGKIKAFKDSYVKEFYYPAHESHVGKKVDWKPFDYYVNDPVYKQCLLLARLDCNVNAKIHNQAAEWESIKKMRCASLDIDSLYRVPFHTACNFLKEPKEYSKIGKVGSLITNRLQDIVQEYSQTAIPEIKKNASQLELVKISQQVKEQIQEIINKGQLPDVLDNELVQAINLLFKNIEIISVKKADILKALFKENELLTKQQFKEALMNFETQVLSKQKGDDIRIKFEDQ